MKRLLFIITVLTLSISAMVIGKTSTPALKWLGHACFVVTSAEGKKLVIDPFSKLGYPSPEVSANVVLVSHNHFDHSTVDTIKDNPEVIRGLNSDGDWNDVDQTVAGFHIKSFACYHDSKSGVVRGKNTIFLIEVDGLRLVHLGDLGHVLNDKTARAIGRVDVLMIPVGGYFTIGPDEAWKVVDQLAPRVIVPMHYKTPVVGKLPIGPVDDFTAKRAKASMRQLKSNTATLVLPKSQQVWIFSLPK